MRMGAVEPEEHPWFFDAHCDTFLKVVERGLDFEDSPELRLNLSGMLEAGLRAQVFAAWTCGERLGGTEDAAALRIALDIPPASEK